LGGGGGWCVGGRGEIRRRLHCGRRGRRRRGCERGGGGNRGEGIRG
jgi:hypothetical protein